MKQLLNFWLLLILLSCASKDKAPAPLNWKEASAKLAREYANSIGPLYPEYVSDLGFKKFDSMTTPYSKDLEKKRYALAYKWQQYLERYLKEIKNPELISDTKILLENVNLEIEGVEIGRKEGIVSFMPLTDYIHSNIKGFLKKDSSKTKIHSGMARFRSYVRGSDNQLPLLDGYMAYLLNQLNFLKENRKRGFWPTREEIESYLDESDEYLKAIEKLLSVWPSDDWRRDFDELKGQDLRYRAYLKKYILPYARVTNLTPPDVYAFSLKAYGIFATPAELVKVAEADYRSTYLEFRKLAREIALARNLQNDDPVSVTKFLEQKKFTDDKELLTYYRWSAAYLMGLVKKNSLLTIENNPNFIVRFGTDAEMQSVPAPHFDSPSLLKEDKTPGQYIIPRPSGSRGMRDYSYKEAIVNLTAHEAVPGHALQYQSMIERGTTLIRAKLAFNSANVEGWAHYAEEIVYPYLTKEEKFITLQRRLWRQARMYLDPLLNLGKIKPARVIEVFTKELGFSKEFAESELKRYSYIMPSQAPAYYYGLKKLMNLKNGIKSRLQAKFNEKCFNDALLDLGVLPLEVISDRLSNLDCGSK